MGGGVIDESVGIDEGVAKEDALLCLCIALGALRGVDLNVGRATEDANAGEARVESAKSGFKGFC